MIPFSYMTIIFPQAEREKCVDLHAWNISFSVTEEWTSGKKKKKKKEKKNKKLDGVVQKACVSAFTSCIL